jgi:hypothetical protein
MQFSNYLSRDASLPEPCLVLLEHYGDHLHLPLCQLILGWHRSYLYCGEDLLARLSEQD